MAELSDTLLVYALTCSAPSGRVLPRLLSRWRDEQGRALAELFAPPEEALRPLLLPEERPVVARARARLEEAQSSLAALEAEGIRAVCRFDPEYPLGLREHLSPGAVPLLFLKGDPRILRTTGVAVVGARAAPIPALEYARALARRLAGAGCNVISGYAQGVDRAAFEGAVEQGNTTVVLPQGIRPFLCDLPRTGGRCAPERVLVISQFLPDAPWAGHQAIARTVVAYALADAIVVVAADADRGGTWIGALEGLRKRRPVFVRRLRHDDRSCPGNARLIERGARPLPDDAEQAAAEILLRFGPTCGSRETPT